MAQRTMEPEQVQAAVRAERLAVAGLAEGLDDAGWSVRSLCPAWTVRDVVAHLTVTTRATLPSVVRDAIRARGSFDRMTVDVAHRRSAAFAPAELVRQLRESAESARRMPLSGPMDPLMDVVVHAQDVARPLGRRHETPPDVAVRVLEHLAGNRLMGGPRRVAGLQLVATDADWSAGEGPRVRGPLSDLLLAVSGRPAGLEHLTGPGVDRLAGRLTAA
ncbi:TIGR03083 family protein [Geodermatophilus dictyosporus]|uniref:TIGR03083 family protein n=1 Tax=Geodermatophilus dictyosporus TaxID=1523247 RepID=A0A1I5V3P3_9ACTN|nr:maleylpyruvate isomerase family mycothiol-dependent enzyme [Geodermatophilus dictyosporus]SFQ02080.1 TIGR03083 family protein [Geodermatophilus dictyosporus]